jgi:hypothetical protein
MKSKDVERANVLTMALEDWRDLTRELKARKKNKRGGTKPPQRGFCLSAGQVPYGWGTRDPDMPGGGFIVLDIATGAKIAAAAHRIIKAELIALGVKP